MSEELRGWGPARSQTQHPRVWGCPEGLPHFRPPTPLLQPSSPCLGRQGGVVAHTGASSALKPGQAADTAPRAYLTPAPGRWSERPAGGPS